MLSQTEPLRDTDSPPPAQIAPDRAIIDTLEAIGTTPFACSLAARIAGSLGDSVYVGLGQWPAPKQYLHRDWETRAQWMELMDDVHEHHALMQ